MATPELSTDVQKKKAGFSSVLIPSFIILGLVVAALFFMKARHGNGPEPILNPLVGDRFPDVELKNLDGSSRKLSSLPGKVFFINFWATWCGPCVSEMPSIQKLYDEYKAKGLVIVAINTDEDPEKTLEPFLKEYKYTFGSYIDKDGEISDHLQVEGLPFTYVLNSDRKIIFTHMGEEEWNSQEKKKLFSTWLGEAQ